nr:Triple gene block 1 Protein [Daphne virus X]
MDQIAYQLSEVFNRTQRPLSLPIVVHAIAGSGKSTCIRGILDLFSNSAAFTFGKPDPFSLERKTIKPFSCYRPAPITIIDEYGFTNEPIPEGTFVILTDPYQSFREELYEPHFTSLKTYRLGPTTCFIINQLFETELTSLAEKETVSFHNIYNFEPVGTIIAFQSEVCELLRTHKARFFHPSEVLGKEFPIVTLILSENLADIPQSERYLLFICLSRHSHRLHILTPNAPDAPFESELDIPNRCGHPGVCDSCLCNHKRH